MTTADGDFALEPGGFVAADRWFAADDRGFAADDRGFAVDDRGFAADDRGFEGAGGGFPADDRGFARRRVLSFIEFSGSGESESKWDYSLELVRYFRLKKEAVKHLGEENRRNESNNENMETIWEFEKLVFYVACDSRTGGCGIGLRVKLENDCSSMI